MSGSAVGNSISITTTDQNQSTRQIITARILPKISTTIHSNPTIITNNETKKAIAMMTLTVTDRP